MVQGRGFQGGFPRFSQGVCEVKTIFIVIIRHYLPFMLSFSHESTKYRKVTEFGLLKATNLLRNSCFQHSIKEHTQFFEKVIEIPSLSQLYDYVSLDFLHLFQSEQPIGTDWRSKYKNIVIFY